MTNKKIQKISRRIIKKIVRQDWMSHVPGWSPGTHGTTYEPVEPPAATAAKAPGYQTAMRSRKSLVNYEIYIHIKVSHHGPLAQLFAPAAKRSSAS